MEICETVLMVWTPGPTVGPVLEQLMLHCYVDEGRSLNKGSVCLIKDSIKPQYQIKYCFDSQLFQSIDTLVCNLLWSYWSCSFLHYHCRVHVDVLITMKSEVRSHGSLPWSFTFTPASRSCFHTNSSQSETVHCTLKKGGLHWGSMATHTCEPQ